MAHTDLLHTEIKLPTCQIPFRLLAKQYWLSCHRPHHPCHHLSTEPAPPRNMKGTLRKCNTEVLPLVDEGINDIEIYFDCLRTLHTQAVTEAISNYTPNIIIIMTHRQLWSVATTLHDVHVPRRSVTSVSSWLGFPRRPAVSMSSGDAPEVFAS